MPKLPVLSGAQVVKALERLGFKFLRQRGSHAIMRKGGIGAVVPMHKEVRLGTLNGILRQAQISPDEFLKALD
jgi:predicted RNA binding protein YcfA (HicA-like mRNA interferase family)